MGDSVLDLALLLDQLHEAPPEDVESNAREEVNPYLLSVILPLLIRGTPPLLRDIDFRQFDEDDPRILASYYADFSQRAYDMGRMNESLCKARPVSARTRAFI